MKALFVLVVGLGTPGLLPGLGGGPAFPGGGLSRPAHRGRAWRRWQPRSSSASAARCSANYVVVAVTANLAMIAWWLAAGRSRQPWAGVPWRWSVSTVVVVAGFRCHPPDRPAFADDRLGRQLRSG